MTDVLLNMPHKKRGNKLGVSCHYCKSSFDIIHTFITSFILCVCINIDNLFLFSI